MIAALRTTLGLAAAAAARAGPSQSGALGEVDRGGPPRPGKYTYRYGCQTEGKGTS